MLTIFFGSENRYLPTAEHSKEINFKSRAKLRHVFTLFQKNNVTKRLLAQKEIINAIKTSITRNVITENVIVRSILFYVVS